MGPANFDPFDPFDPGWLQAYAAMQEQVEPAGQEEIEAAGQEQVGQIGDEDFNVTRSRFPGRSRKQVISG